MKEKLARLWQRVKRGCVRAVRKAAPAIGRGTLRFCDLFYRYHYWLGVAVLRRGRHVYRVVGRITRKPRRFLRYAWVAWIYRPVHRFLRRMWRLITGLPRSYIELWKSMKKDALNFALFLPHGLFRWLRDYKEEWFTLGRFVGPIAAAVVLVSTIQLWTQTRFCLVLSYRGDELGIIENAAVYDKGASMARSRVTNIDDNQFTVDAVPTLTMVIRGAKSTMTASDVCDAILSKSFEKEEIMEATAFYMDGNFMGAVADSDALEAMLEEIKAHSLGEEDATPDAETDLTVVSQRIEFVQDIKTETGLFPIDTLKSVEDIRKQLESKTTVEQVYTVQSGDTFSGIASKHNMTSDELKALNPQIENTNKLQIGQELLVQRPQYFLQVVVVKTVRKEGVKVPYKTRTVYRDDKYTDWSNVKTKGVDGTKTVYTDITMLDGYELESVVTEEVITKEAVTKVVEVGTKKRPTNQGNGITTGTMTWPVPVCHRVYVGYSSSHKAIDISSGPVPVLGKPAVAADGGVVIEASTGWNGGYGTVVKIQHSNGLITVYAHLQTLKVVKGQKVSAGQTIGLIGNTGRSFGPHLHFEVIKNGVKVNPLNYVKPQ